MASDVCGIPGVPDQLMHNEHAVIVTHCVTPIKTLWWSNTSSKAVVW